MKVGDLIKFRRTGVLATIVDKTTAEEYGQYMLTIFVHGVAKYKNPSKVTMSWLDKQVVVVQ